MAFQKDPRTRCSACALYLDSIQRECCIKSCIPFLDTVFISESNLSLASLPQLLDFRMVENERFVISRVGIPVRSIFGPLIAPTQRRSSSPSHAKYAIGSYEHGWIDFVLEPDELCNWMKYVRQAENPEEQNLTAFQFRGSVYFVTIKEIRYGDELKVWYANNYAVDMERVSVPGFKVNSTSLQAVDSFITQQLPVRNQPVELHSSDIIHLSETTVLHPAQYQFTSLRNNSPNEASCIEVAETTAQIDFSAFWESMDLDIAREGGGAANENDSATMDLKQNFVKDQQKSLFQQEHMDEDQRISSQTSADQIDKSDRLFRCGVCSERFCAEDRLKAHIRESHDLHISKNGESNPDGKSLRKCMFCLKHFKYKVMRQHFSTHCDESGMYACRLCQKTFNSPVKVRNHLDYLHKPHQLACGICDFSTPKAYLLKRHLATHSKAQESLKQIAAIQAEKALIKCILCLLTFREQKALGEHFSTHQSDRSEYTCQFCHKTFENLDKARKHNYVHRPNQSSCEICGHTTKTPRMLKLHMVTHSKAELECLHCILKFKEKDALRKHTLLMHNPNKPKKTPRKRIKNNEASAINENHFYKCRDCNLGFYHRKSLLAHLDSRHPDLPRHAVPELNLPVKKVNAYQCRDCKTRFLMEEHARHHLKKHVDTGNGPEEQDAGDIEGLMKSLMKPHLFNAHWCELCGCYFLGGKVLLKHVRAAHPEYMSILMPSDVTSSKSTTE